MPALQVRDLPDDLYEKLKENAQRGRRSISQQTIVILQDYLDAHESAAKTNTKKGPRYYEEPSADISLDKAFCAAERADRRQRIFDLIDQLPKLNVPDDFPDVVTLVREGREAR